MSVLFVSHALLFQHLLIPSFLVEEWPIHTNINFPIFVFFCSWSQILETLPLPNVRILFFFKFVASLYRNFSMQHAYLLPLVLQHGKNVLSFHKFIYSIAIAICDADQMDLPDSSYSTCSFTWWISMHCL